MNGSYLEWSRCQKWQELFNVKNIAPSVIFYMQPNWLWKLFVYVLIISLPLKKHFGLASCKGMTDSITVLRNIGAKVVKRESA